MIAVSDVLAVVEGKVAALRVRDGKKGSYAEVRVDTGMSYEVVSFKPEVARALKQGDRVRIPVRAFAFNGRCYLSYDESRQVEKA